MSISFTARFVDSTKIKHRLSFFKNEKLETSIIELDKKNPDDMKALHDAAFSWYDNGGRYATNIYHKATDNTYLKDVTKEHYFALTTQKNDFENVKPNKILGLMMFSETSNFDNEINYLEVNPSTNRSKHLIREYKNVGKALVDYVKRAYKEKSLFVFSDARVIKFYKKQGFFQMYKDTPEQRCQMYYRK